MIIALALFFLSIGVPLVGVGPDDRPQRYSTTYEGAAFPRITDTTSDDEQEDYDGPEVQDQDLLVAALEEDALTQPTGNDPGNYLADTGSDNAVALPAQLLQLDPSVSNVDSHQHETSPLPAATTAYSSQHQEDSAPLTAEDTVQAAQSTDHQGILHARRLFANLLHKMANEIQELMREAHSPDLEPHFERLKDFLQRLSNSDDIIADASELDPLLASITTMLSAPAAAVAAAVAVETPLVDTSVSNALPTNDGAHNAMGRRRCLPRFTKRNAALGLGAGLLLATTGYLLTAGLGASAALCGSTNLIEEAALTTLTSSYPLFQCLTQWCPTSSSLALSLCSLVGNLPALPELPALPQLPQMPSVSLNFKPLQNWNLNPQSWLKNPFSRNNKIQEEPLDLDHQVPDTRHSGFCPSNYRAFQTNVPGLTRRIITCHEEAGINNPNSCLMISKGLTEQLEQLATTLLVFINRADVQCHLSPELLAELHTNFSRALSNSTNAHI